MVTVEQRKERCLYAYPTEDSPQRIEAKELPPNDCMKKNLHDSGASRHCQEKTYFEKRRRTMNDERIV